jgi:hypothetical protein
MAFKKTMLKKNYEFIIMYTNNEFIVFHNIILGFNFWFLKLLKIIYFIIYLLELSIIISYNKPNKSDVNSSLMLNVCINVSKNKAVMLINRHNIYTYEKERIKL